MAKAKKTGGGKGRSKNKPKDVNRYTHGGKKRVNNPPVGLVTPRTDPDLPSREYSYDPRRDPQLLWSGKRESFEFEVDTVSLHVHERIDPLTILEKAMKPKSHMQQTMFNYFEKPENNLPLRKAIDFYKHKWRWSNRLIAGDSLLVMNSLLEKEGMGEKIQMIYIDPPYGIKYGSNFQPFVNKRSVTDGKDDDLTQEPEMIKAFRDTWELEIHSYLTYLRDRLLLAKELLTESGSCIVQISIENIALVRLIMDEIFENKNFINMITVQKTTSSTSKTLDSVGDYLLWYAKDHTKLKYRDLYMKKDFPINDHNYRYLELEDGTRRSMTKEERDDIKLIPNNSKIFTYDNLTSASGDHNLKFEFDGQIFDSGNRSWTTSTEGLSALVAKNRIDRWGKGIGYIRYFNDFPYRSLNNIWTDSVSSFAKKIYVVQTIPKIIERIMLMTTDPDDIVFDPTCGSGTTAFVAEKWGRRWITCDTSRIAVILAKQRLMTSIFKYYELLSPDEGISSGFNYETVDHITMGSIVNDEPPKREIMYDRPYIDKTRVRISGPFTMESVPAPTVKSIDFLSNDSHKNTTQEDDISYQHQWRHELLKTGIRCKDNKNIEFIRMETHPTTKWLHADAKIKEENPRRAMVSFGPKYAPLEQRQVALAIEEAHKLVPMPKIIIFAAMQFDPEASKDIEELSWPEVTILKVDINKDLLTGDLKKKRSSNESFWLVGQPDVDLRKINGKYVIKVNGFDYYNAKKDKIESGGLSKIPMWMLDTDYDGRSIYPQQVFFPMDEKTGGWNRLAKTLQAQLDEKLIAKYQGIESIPFEAGSNKRAAIKVIDDRGIGSLKIISLE